ncbi:hypothetical protein [Haloarchaeobius sp. HRN-SO-5]|uniref:hypothetical protein n=1 Tax=Haloarchaeobius sp. HRN-SO-5 TaxID=3446118 RepID=UPI003EBEE1E5
MDPTTNARVRAHFEGADAPYAATVSPGNGAATAVSEDTRAHVVNPDGTNSVTLDAAAKKGHVLTVVHNGGANTPTLSFADADFVGTGPANMTSAGATATLLNTDGTTSGWVVVATGSA